MNFTVKKGDEVVVRCDTTHGYEYRRAKVERVTPKEGQIVLDDCKKFHRDGRGMYDTEEELLPATEENLALVRIEELRLDIKSRALDIFQTVRRMSPQDLERASRGIDLALGIEPDRTVEQRRAEEKASESESGCPVLTAEEFQQALQELQEPSEL